MVSQNYEIATILPPHEQFSSAAAGSVALFVRDTSQSSAYHNYITVYGCDTGKNRRFANIRFKAVTPSFRPFQRKAACYAMAVAKELQARRPGLIEVHNCVTTFNTLAKIFPNTPISIYFHDDPSSVKGATTPKLRWKILSRADGIYCCSDYIRRRFLTGLEAGRTDHVHVVYQGVDIAASPHKEKVILYVGHLAKEKGVLELAQAARILLPHFPDWRIVFIGASRPGKASGSYARAVGETVKPLGKQAVFMGHQQHDKILKLFSQAAIAVVPSMWNESAGRTAIEAMAGGCALVTSGYGGLAELAGETGILVNPVTPQGLALALQGLIEDAESLRGMQQMCYERGLIFSINNAQNYFDQLRYQLLSQAYGG